MVGESQKIALPKASSVQVSRKGIVDLQLYHDHIRLVAVKSGLVVLALSQETKPDEDFKYFIEVRPKVKDDLASLPELTKLCQGTGLQFDIKREQLRGSTDDFRLFYQTKDICDAQASCAFQAHLSAAASDQLKIYIESLLGEKFEVLVKETGAILALASCSDSLTEKNQRKIAEHLIGSPFFKKNLLVVCKKDWHAKSYLLFSKVIVLEKSAARELGLQTGLDGRGSLARNNFRVDLDWQLHAALKTRQAKIIGEPVIFLVGGAEAHLQSGSEILVSKDTTEGLQAYPRAYAWKDLGLDLKIKVFPFEAKMVRLQYSFTVANPSSKGGSQIHKNKIASEIELPLDKSSIVGGIQFKSDGQQEGSIPFLNSLPILGPLIRKSTTNDMETSLYLHFYLKAADGQDLTNPQTSPLSTSSSRQK